jgi:hypothetical protein
VITAVVANPTVVMTADDNTPAVVIIAELEIPATVNVPALDVIEPDAINDSVVVIEALE